MSFDHIFLLNDKKKRYLYLVLRPGPQKIFRLSSCTPLDYLLMSSSGHCISLQKAFIGPQKIEVVMINK